jgi:hypothetical protein
VYIVESVEMALPSGWNKRVSDWIATLSFGDIKGVQMGARQKFVHKFEERITGGQNAENDELPTFDGRTN